MQMDIPQLLKGLTNSDVWGLATVLRIPLATRFEGDKTREVLEKNITEKLIIIPTDAQRKIKKLLVSIRKYNKKHGG